MFPLRKLHYNPRLGRLFSVNVHQYRTSDSFREGNASRYIYAEADKYELQMQKGLEENSVWSRRDFAHLLNVASSSSTDQHDLLKIIHSLIYVCRFRMKSTHLSSKREYIRKICAILDEKDCKMSIELYNSILKSNLQNEQSFSPAEAVQKLNKLDISPNSDTFQLFIRQYCLHGDIEAARAILVYMKSQKLPISEKILHDLVFGYHLKGDRKQADDLMEQVLSHDKSLSKLGFQCAIGCSWAKLGDLHGVSKCLQSIIHSDMIDFSEKSQHVYRILRTVISAGHEKLLKNLLPKINSELASLIPKLCRDLVAHDKLEYFPLLFENANCSVEMIKKSWSDLISDVFDNEHFSQKADQLLIAAKNLGQLGAKCDIFSSLIPLAINNNFANFDSIFELFIADFAKKYDMHKRTQVIFPYYAFLSRTFIDKLIEMINKDDILKREKILKYCIVTNILAAENWLEIVNKLANELTQSRIILFSQLIGHLIHLNDLEKIEQILTKSNKEKNKTIRLNIVYFSNLFAKNEFKFDANIMALILNRGYENFPNSNQFLTKFFTNFFCNEPKISVEKANNFIKLIDEKEIIFDKIFVKNKLELCNRSDLIPALNIEISTKKLRKENVQDLQKDFELMSKNRQKDPSALLSLQKTIITELVKENIAASQKSSDCDLSKTTHLILQWFKSSRNLGMEVSRAIPWCITVSSFIQLCRHSQRFDLLQSLLVNIPYGTLTQSVKTWKLLEIASRWFLTDNLINMKDKLKFFNWSKGIDIELAVFLCAKNDENQQNCSLFDPENVQSTRFISCISSCAPNAKNKQQIERQRCELIVGHKLARNDWKEAWKLAKQQTKNINMLVGYSQLLEFAIKNDNSNLLKEVFNEVQIKVGDQMAYLHYAYVLFSLKKDHYAMQLLLNDPKMDFYILPRPFFYLLQEAKNRNNVHVLRGFMNIAFLRPNFDPNYLGILLHFLTFCYVGNQDQLGFEELCTQIKEKEIELSTDFASKLRNARELLDSF